MAEPRTARQIAEHMIRVAAQNADAMPIREATPRERRLLGMEDYDFLIDDVVDEIDKAVVTVTWPEPLPDGVQVITVTVTTDRPEGAAEDIKALLAGADYHAVTVTP